MYAVTNSPSKEAAIQAAARFLAYYPYRIAGIVQMKSGVWGWTAGKTMARLNRLARAGLPVYRVMR